LGMRDYQFDGQKSNDAGLIAHKVSPVRLDQLKLTSSGSLSRIRLVTIRHLFFQEKGSLLRTSFYFFS